MLLSARLTNVMIHWMNCMFIPVRVKGRNVGKPEWGKFEVLQDGEWIEYNPER